MGRVGCVAALAMFFAGALHSAWADEVVLRNGDRLTGTVVKAEGGKLTVQTPYAASIEVDLAAVAEIRTDNPVELRTVGGEVLKGVLKTSAPDRFVVESSDTRDAVPVRWENVTAINPPPVKPVTWDGSITLAGSLQNGNTDRESGSVGIEGMRKTAKDKYSLRLLYNIAAEDDRLSERNVYGAMKYNYLITRALYWYLSLELLVDEFKDLNLRTVIGPGLGYQVWDDERRTLDLEAGVAYFSEDFEVAEDNQFITGRLAADLRYRLFDEVDFVDHFVIYPDLENFGDYQLRNEAAIAKKLGGNWSVKVANILEYDSDPPEDVAATDVTWLAGIQYDF